MIILKIKIIDENNFILFIIDSKMMPNLNCEKELSAYLKNIFLNIKEKYELDVYGYYNAIIYIDDSYGMIIKLTREDSEYISYYNKQVEMKIIIANKTIILYKINDFEGIDDNIINTSNIYFYDKNLYLQLKEKHNYFDLGKFLEFAEIIYENTEMIIKYGEKIEIG